MFRIRRVYDDVLPVNQRAIAEVERILVEQFVGLPESELGSLGRRLRDPFERRLKALLHVAEDPKEGVIGFALLLHATDLDFAYLDYLAAGRGLTSRGVGGALYERVREEAAALGCRAIFFECLPDDPEAEPDEETRRDNAARLRFYEAYGARPIVGNRYATPVDPTDPSPHPYLVVDPLGEETIPRAWLRKVVRAILERKYGRLCPPEYVDGVVASFRDPTAVLRPPRTLRRPPRPAPAGSRRDRVVLVVNDRHDIHHVRDRGYVESPVRIPRLLAALEPTGWFRRLPTARHPSRHVTAVHDRALVDFLRRASAEVAEGRSLYPYVFPIRNKAKLPRDRSVLAGYYCIDTFTPIHRNSYRAARRAVDSTLTAADQLLSGAHLAYALVRPPGHHAERSCFGGFCYLNNAAVAAHYLSQHGKVVILDIDYHHGNGQQEIFYARQDVLTISVHGHPRFAYPYFSGFEDERGEGPGAGLNVNLPLPAKTDGRSYGRALGRALDAVSRFAPLFLLVALGLDTAKGDPTGSWSLGPRDFTANGRRIGELGLPTLVVQEGGYRTRTLGSNARSFFDGLLSGCDLR